MKKVDPNLKKNFFIGVCNKCGETYEASSAVDDLEGISFQCKKMLCTGRVEMSAVSSSNHVSSESGDSNNTDQPPRRYC